MKTRWTSNVIPAWLLLAALPACGPAPTETPAASTPPPTQGASPTATPGVPTPTATVADTPPPALVADLEGRFMLLAEVQGHNPIAVIRMLDGAKVWEMDPVSLSADLCNNGKTCFFNEVHHRNLATRDYLDYVMNRGIQQISSLHSVAMDDPGNLAWQMKGFDFSGVPGAGCDLPAEDTCDPEKQLEIDPLCTMGFVHSFEVLQDDGETIGLLAADHLNARLAWLTLDRSGGHGCAKVEWVVNDDTPGWPAQCMPNSVDVIRDLSDERDYLLVSCRNVADVVGSGKLVLMGSLGGKVFDEDGVSLPAEQVQWDAVWTFPEDPSAEEVLPLNSPHRALVMPLESGGLRLLYAHSGGLDPVLNQTTAGTLGSAWLEDIESPPEYMGDLYIDEADGTVPLGFVSNIDLLPDGRYVLADSQNFIVIDGHVEYIDDRLSRVMMFDPVVPQTTTDRGSWTETHEDQNLTPNNAQLLLSYECGWNNLYSAEWIDVEEQGFTFQQLVDAPPIACVDP